jgi:hypothetical protein
MHMQTKVGDETHAGRGGLLWLVLSPTSAHAFRESERASERERERHAHFDKVEDFAAV